VLAWGSNVYGQTNVPAGLANAMAIAAGDNHSVALMANGTVVVWGDNRLTQLEMPAGLTNVIAISAGPAYTLALKNDGSVIGWGDGSSGQTEVPADVTNAVAVFASGSYAFALLPNGNVRQWGNGPVWQHNGVTTQLEIESSLSNVTAIAAGQFDAWSLQSDGTVVPWGFLYGVGPGAFTNTYLISTSSGLATGKGNQRPIYSNVVDIAGGGIGIPSNDYVLMLLNDGTVTSLNPFALPIPANPGHAVRVATDHAHGMVLVNDGSPSIVSPLVARTTIAGKGVTFSAGVVGSSPLSYQWQFNGTNIDGGTNAQLVLSNLSLTGSGFYQCIVTNSLGAVTNGIELTLTRGLPYLGIESFMGGSGLQLNVNQLSGHGPIVIYSSTNMTDWKPIFTNPPTAGTIDWIDSSATNSSTLFYRAVEQ